MIRTSLFLGTLAVLTVGGFGCTQTGQSGTQNKTAYYHDRRAPIGSNIPKSYGDASSADAQQSDLDRNSFQRSQTTFNSAGGGAGATGGR